MECILFLQRSSRRRSCHRWGQKAANVVVCFTFAGQWYGATLWFSGQLTNAFRYERAFIFDCSAPFAH
uniref:Uncharacterized protein n=1 Tax=Oryza meridionalis TaxID=40149 RepID=A0A0E0EZT9_9ORYZ